MKNEQPSKLKTGAYTKNQLYKFNSKITKNILNHYNINIPKNKYDQSRS